MNTPNKQKIKERIIQYKTDPVLFLEQSLNCQTFVEFQKNLCRQVVKHDKLNIRACHSVGKTFTVARIALWFLYCFAHSKVITTAPTYRQVVKLLWGEIRKARKKSRVYLGGKSTLTEIEIDDDWYAIGFTPQTRAGSGDEQIGSTFQGFHARYILIVFDEATGIPKDLFTMAEGLMTSGIIVKWICIGNPTTRSSQVFKLLKQVDWRNLKIDCFMSPNMIENGFVNLESVENEIMHLRTLSDAERLERIKNYKKPNPDLINAQWVIPKIYDWGTGHPLTMSKILAEFPGADDNSIVQWDSVTRAFARDYEIQAGDKRYIGVDVARFGDDLTVFTEIIGYRVTRKLKLAKRGNTEVAGELVQFINGEHFEKETAVLIDATGLGSGVVDIMRDNSDNSIIPPRVEIVEIHFAYSVELKDKTKEKEENKKWANLKTKMFDKLNHDLKNNLSLDEDESLEEELPAIVYKLDPKGRMRIEKKEKFKARAGRSPDNADSLALANFGRYLADEVGSWRETKIEKDKAKPFSKKRRERKARIKVKEY